MSHAYATVDHRATGSKATISVCPLTLPAPGRGDDLEVRITAPLHGRELPLILFSHGMTLTMRDYVPLIEYWAAQGFVVIQPTHLDSLALSPDDSRNPEIWNIRVRDLTTILDQLDELEAALPVLSGRIDHRRVVAAGHSWGAQTASMLAGARVLDATGKPGGTMADSRVTAALLFCLPGTGGADLTPLAAQYFPFMNPYFADLTTPSLVVAGNRDQSPLSVRGPDWFVDGYRLSPGARDLLVLADAEHGLGGIQGSNDTRTTDESPQRVALIQRATTAWLRTVLDMDKDAWPVERQRLAVDEHVADIECK
ncbi:alpha/beta hydrolase family protein [Mycobacterium paraterrae]|uniref:Alpha/beta fold hydrolase n=1 Tax=Mycobacterium paraterrae TaxID=577492 RepID=A0ABY3VJZ9_9MYCO|nr:alpha/beta fold hydrolase [Mycobacterium paraterrae]UMB69592.1 alpha/beta fold hydrolase [Mycobacterium paraterrae]